MFEPAVSHGLELRLHFQKRTLLLIKFFAILISSLNDFFLSVFFSSGFTSPCCCIRESRISVLLQFIVCSLLERGSNFSCHGFSTDSGNAPLKALVGFSGKLIGFCSKLFSRHRKKIFDYVSLIPCNSITNYLLVLAQFSILHRTCFRRSRRHRRFCSRWNYNQYPLQTIIVFSCSFPEIQFTIHAILAHFLCLT